MTVVLPPAFETFLSNLLAPVNEPTHLKHLSDYMAGGGYTGAAFETLTVDGASPNCVDVSDLAALWTLSVPLKWRQSKALLETHSAQISDLLAQIQDRPLASLSAAELDELNRDSSPESQLWKLIRSIDYMGPTRTSKLLARKRPQLIPIYDTFVESVLGLETSKDQWSQFHEALSRNGAEVEARLLELGAKAGHPELSALRVFDILVWMEKRVGEDLGKQ